VLTQTLRKLERDGYVSRQVFPTSPPTVEYWLTPMGTSLLDPMGKLVMWANDNFDQVMKARKKFDEMKPTTAVMREHQTGLQKR
jgi:DNA-binding HxlR family transcriptional regulator